MVAAYTAVILMRLFNNTPLWLFVVNLFDTTNRWLLVSGNLGPTAVYLLAIILLLWSINRWANKLDS